MLSFEIAREGREIHVNCDERGAAVLINAVEQARAARGDVYLRAPSKGGHELSDKSAWETDALGEVIITWVGG